MRFRRQYTLYSDKAVKGKPIWYFRVYLPDGTRRAKSTGCTSKEKARIYVEGLLNNESLLRKVFETDLVIKVDSSNTLLQTNIVESNEDVPTFAEYASPWWKWDTCPYVLARRAAGTEKHPGIKQSYVKSSEMWTRTYLIPYFGKCKLNEISVDMVNSFWQVLKEKHNLAPKTINNIRSVFIIMMKEAVNRELIESNPVEKTFARTVDKKKQKLLTDEECAKLFDIERIKDLWKDKIVYYAYSFVAGLTGMRAGELLALTINDITSSKIYVRKSYSGTFGMSTTKTSEERVIPITPEIYRVLYVAWQSHPNDECDFIFSFDGKKPMNEGRARAAFYAALEKIGISEKERKARGITFHSWRHKFTTDCIRSNMHPEKIKALTGHHSMEMLSRYTDLDAERDIASQINEIQSTKGKEFTNGLK